MGKKQTVVKFRVTSYEGDSEYELPSSSAFAEIKKLMDEQNKWVYINGEIQNNELLTESDLVKATEEQKPIMLMNALAGGMDKIVDIDFKVSKKSKHAIEVDFEENKYAKIFKITLNPECVTDIVRNRENLFRVFKKKLNDLVKDQTEKFEEELDDDRDAFEDALIDLTEDFDNKEVEKIDSFEDKLNVKLEDFY